MTKRLNDPYQRNVGHTDESRVPSGHGRGNGSDWHSHGGRHIASGPSAGRYGVARSDGPDRAGTGQQGDLRGPPRRPR
jgi:hypothetical protein